MSRIRLAVATALLAVGVSLTATTPPATATSAMSQDYAGKYYLAQVCATNPVRDKVYRALFRGKNSLKAKQIKGKRLRQTRKALHRLERSDYNAGRRLLNPPGTWPTADITSAANAVANAAIRESKMASTLAKRRTKRFAHYFTHVFDPDTQFQDASRNARALLDLPPNGEGC
jgi:hypothetical protein